MEGENNDMAIGVEEGDVTILFAPLSIQASITASSDPNDTGGLDRRMVEVHYRSISTAWLVLYNDQGPNTSATMYILDLMAKIYKETEKTDEDGQIVSISYNYVRLNEYVQFESLAINRDGVRDIQVLAVNFYKRYRNSMLYIRLLISFSVNFVSKKLLLSDKNLRSAKIVGRMQLRWGLKAVGRSCALR